MQGHIFVFLLVAVALTKGFIFDSNTCPIIQYKGGRNLVGYKLLIHNAFNGSVAIIERAAKDCNVLINVVGSYYQLATPYQYVPIADKDLVIGHGFRFDVRDTNNAVLCTSYCLQNNPMDLPQVRCLLNAVQLRGITWSRYNSNVFSDGTYAANQDVFTSLQSDIQTKCQNQGYKRQLLRTLREMYEQQESEDGNSLEEEKKK